MNRTITAPAPVLLAPPPAAGRRWPRVLVAACLALVAGLATVAVTNEGTLLAFDTVVQDQVISARTGWLNQAMIWLTFLGTRYAVGALAFGLVLWSGITGRARLLVGVMVGAVLLNPLAEIGVKELVGRVRPNEAQLLPGNGPSFPSGHVLASVGFYGMLPMLAWATRKRLWVKITSVIAAAVVILTVAASRVYLDVHWTTDVIAGLALGTVLVAASLWVHKALAQAGWDPRDLGVPVLRPALEPALATAGSPTRHAMVAHASR